MTRPLFLLLVLLSLSACSGSGSGDPDVDRVQELIEDGVDASQTHTLRFSFLFADETAAKKVCKRLRTEGFTPQLGTADDSRRFSCQGIKQFPLEPKLLRQLRLRFEVLAQNFGGEFKGWELVTPAQS